MENLLISAFIAFLATCATRYFLFCIGNPLKGEDYIDLSAIFSRFGRYVANKYLSTNHEVRPVFWKVFICPYCLVFWFFTLFHFTAFAFGFYPYMGILKSVVVWLFTAPLSAYFLKYV